jgi:hypothetical protein
MVLWNNLKFIFVLWWVQRNQKFLSSSLDAWSKLIFYRKHKQYYPVKADGNIDEWEALSRQQQELYKKSQEEEKQQKDHQK